jgi:hypothetical protein
MNKRRLSLRTKKSYDQYIVKTGSAGFVQLFKNGKRIMPKYAVLVFNLKKDNKAPLSPTRLMPN